MTCKSFDTRFLLTISYSNSFILSFQEIRGHFSAFPIEFPLSDYFSFLSPEATNLSTRMDCSQRNTA